MNEVKISGTLTRDAELRYVKGGTLPLCKINAKTPGGYIDFTAWESVAEKCAGLQKGQEIEIEGRLNTETWDDKATGQKRYKLGIVVHKLVSPAVPDSEYEEQPKVVVREDTPVDEDSIPF